jgi:Tol biopolymer transport system component
VRRLSPAHDARDSQPACAPDGRTVAFVRETIHGIELRLLDLRPRRSRSLRRLDDPSADPAWSPAGNRLAYTESVEGLRLLDVRTGGIAVLSRGYDEHASWSADGRRIAFSHDRTGNGDTSIWTMKADGTARRRLTHGNDDRAPAWSPDGHRIAFQRGDDVWLVDADGGNERLAAASAQAPTWAPDGTLVVSEYRLGGSGLYALRPGGRPRRIVSGAWPEACWAPS